MTPTILRVMIPISQKSSKTFEFVLRIENVFVYVTKSEKKFFESVCYDTKMLQAEVENNPKIKLFFLFVKNSL